MTQSFKAETKLQFSIQTPSSRLQLTVTTLEASGTPPEVNATKWVTRISLQCDFGRRLLQPPAGQGARRRLSGLLVVSMDAVWVALLGLGRTCGDRLEQALCLTADELGRRACVMLALVGAPQQMCLAEVEVAGGNRAVKSSAIPMLNSPGNGYRFWTVVIARDRDHHQNSSCLRMPEWLRIRSNGAMASRKLPMALEECFLFAYQRQVCITKVFRVLTLTKQF